MRVDCNWKSENTCCWCNVLLYNQFCGRPWNFCNGFIEFYLVHYCRTFWGHTEHTYVQHAWTLRLLPLVEYIWCGQASLCSLVSPGMQGTYNPGLHPLKHILPTDTKSITCISGTVGDQYNHVTCNPTHFYRRLGTVLSVTHDTGSTINTQGS